MAMQLDEAEQEALLIVVAYAATGEQRDFEEMAGRGEDVSGHIWHSLVLLADRLCIEI